jgi:hypothetical protein
MSAPLHAFDNFDSLIVDCHWDKICNHTRSKMLPLMEGFNWNTESASQYTASCCFHFSPKFAPQSPGTNFRQSSCDFCGIWADSWAKGTRQKATTAKSINRAEFMRPSVSSGSSSDKRQLPRKSVICEPCSVARKEKKTKTARNGAFWVETDCRENRRVKPGA